MVYTVTLIGVVNTVTLIGEASDSHCVQGDITA